MPELEPLEHRHKARRHRDVALEWTRFGLEVVGLMTILAAMAYACGYGWR